MKRREFITLLGGAAVAWPLAARAQQIVPILGFLHQGSPDQFEYLTAGFRKGLKQSGYVDGENLLIEYRWAEGHYDRLAELASDLVRRKVSVIVSVYALAGFAAKDATSTIPIVFLTGADPVRERLVSALNRPGANVTGVTYFGVLLGAKRLSLLHDLLPRATRFALLINPSNRVATENYVEGTEEAANKLGLQIVIVSASSEREIDERFATIAEQRIDALIFAPDAFLVSRQHQIVSLAARHAIPTMYSEPEAVLAGGLVSYGADVGSAYREVGLYAARILKGEKPSDLPVVQSTKFQLVLNLKTAKALGLTIPQDVLSIADEVIE